MNIDNFECIIKINHQTISLGKPKRIDDFLVFAPKKEIDARGLKFISVSYLNSNILSIEIHNIEKEKRIEIANLSAYLDIITNHSGSIIQLKFHVNMMELSSVCEHMENVVKGIL